MCQNVVLLCNFLVESIYGDNFLRCGSPATRLLLCTFIECVEIGYKLRFDDVFIGVYKILLAFSCDDPSCVQTFYFKKKKKILCEMRPFHTKMKYNLKITF